MKILRLSRMAKLLRAIPELSIVPWGEVGDHGVFWWFLLFVFQEVVWFLV